MNRLIVEGFPEDICETEEAICRSRLLKAVRELCEQTGIEDIDLRVSTGTGRKQLHEQEQPGTGDAGDVSIEDRAAQYRAGEPLWKSDHLVVPDVVREELRTAMEVIRLEPLIFDGWGLREIEPFPRSILNFHGPPGTGKTLAAHAVASEIGKRILVASYARIESKFHGEGPKNVDALFFAAERDEAVLFIDEADSLLSRRLANVTQGSEQAINSMRSQLLICLEKHKGLVIFATNLVENYDPAFETRMRHVRFTLPDAKARARIWTNHLPTKLPLDGDVNVAELAVASDGLCGRDIKNSVIDAALRAARHSRCAVRQSDLLGAVERVLLSRTKSGLGASGIPSLAVPAFGERSQECDMVRPL